ncbi:MAG: helix-turn-helix domain-containing protein [Limosilactobacillus sp.]
MGRKVSFEEKCKIVQWVLDHDNDYQGATIQFNVSYQHVYSWVRKYHEAADSWEVLKDNRGHRKPQKALEEMTEKERLEAEIKRLKKINREMELEIAFAKKLVEIRNRGVKRPDDIKRFKN